MVKQWIARVVLGRTSVGMALEPSDRPDETFEATWRPRVKSRLLVALMLLAIWGTALEARLIFLQVVSHERFATAARQQQLYLIEAEPARGDIVDRHGEVLAYSVESHRVIAIPKRSKEPAKDAAAICTALGDCTAKEQAKLAANLAGKGQYLVVRNPRFVSPAASLSLPEVVSLFRESRRYYPKLTLASQVLGFVNGDGRGVEGIEAKYEKVISGSKGRAFVQVDGLGGREIATRVERAPTAGATLELTIDLRLQHIAEREIKRAVDELNADGASVIAMDPFTGEILAHANYPTFNPNAYWDAPADAKRNRAVTDPYEPGSTFKIVTGSAALNEGVWSTTELIDTSPGIIKIPGRRKPIDDDGKNYGVLSFENVLVKSSNVGAIRIGQRLGADRLMQYVRRFGFGQVLAPDFGSQSRGQVHQAAHVSESSLASMSMGYEIGVTPIQLAAAASVVANGGVLVEPRIVRAIIRGDRRELVEPKALRRVITPETAATMTAIMEGVVDHGTARAAAMERYRVAGKTGTAAKAVPGVGYSQTDYNVSFVGFVPSRRPALTVLVVIDTPRRGRAYGGSMAAPVFKRIAEAALQQMGISPSINPAPPIITTSARQLLPAPPSRAGDILPTIARVGGRPVMPDLEGLSLRDALRVVHELGLSMTTDGEGMVIGQIPTAGEFVEPGGTGTLKLSRRPAADRRER